MFGAKLHLLLLLLAASCSRGQVSPSPRGDIAQTDLAGADARIDRTLLINEDAQAGIDATIDEGLRSDAPADASRDDSLRPDTTTNGAIIAPFTLTFEHGDGGLMGSKDWQWGEIGAHGKTNCDSGTTPPVSAHSGNYAWGTIIDACHRPLDNVGLAINSCVNVTTVDDSVLTLQIEIPQGWSTASLSFFQWYDVAGKFDFGEVYIDGAQVESMCQSRVTPTEWVGKTIDLKPWIGKTITVGFHFVATGTVNRTGWYIDDIAVRGG